MFKTVRRLIQWTGPYRRRLNIGYIFSILTAIFTSLPIMLTAYGMNLVISNWQDGNTLESGMIWGMLLLLIVLILGRALFSYLRAKWQDSIAYEQTAEERIIVGDILKRVSLGFFSKMSEGEIASAVTTDLSYFEMFSMKMLDTIVTGYLTAAVMVISLAFFSIPAAIVSVVGIGLSGIALYVMFKKSRKNAVVHQKAQDEMAAAVLEYVHGISLAKAFKCSTLTSQWVEKAFKEHCHINIKIEKEFAWCNGAHLLVLKIASIGIVFVSALMALNGAISLGVMLMMMLFSFVIFGHVEAINNATHVMTILDEVMDKLELIKKAEVIDSDGKDIALESQEIIFDKVSFSYDQRRVIDNVSFRIPEKTVTAIVGPSGGGKTTLTSLMARFYDVDSGSISVGGQDIRGMTCDSLLMNYSMVFQKVYLFKDTIKNNICFGRADATREEVVEAAKKACCHDFISNLPNGYETLVGEGGATLSGGEKQRISIARAMLKNAPIVILDEATASIDPENEQGIQQGIENLVHDKTLIIIAHRLATVQSADQILVVEGGRICEKGKHADLLEKDGIYRRFWNLRKDAENWEV